jgi:hypothetical protein
MSLSRPLQKKSAKKRFFGAGFFRKFCKGALAFLTAGGVILCSLDAPLFVGVAMSLTSPVFLFFVGASLCIGGLLALEAVEDDRANQKQINILTAENQVLRDKREKKIKELIDALSQLENVLIQWKENAEINEIQFQRDIRFLRSEIHKLRNETYETSAEADNKIKSISTHIKSLQAHFRVLFQQEEASTIPKPFLGKPDGNDKGRLYSFYSRLKSGMAFLGGASTVVGLAGTVVGVMGTSIVLLPPFFTFFVAGIILAALLTGLLTYFIDFKLTKIQDTKISALEESNHEIEVGNKKIGGLVKQVRAISEVVQVKIDALDGQKELETELSAEKTKNQRLAKQNLFLWKKIPETERKNLGLFREVSRAGKAVEENVEAAEPAPSTAASM